MSRASLAVAMIAALLVIAAVWLLTRGGEEPRPSTRAPADAAVANATSAPDAPRDRRARPSSAPGMPDAPDFGAAPVVDDPDDCVDVCGLPCARDNEGRWRCPPSCVVDADCGEGEICTWSALDIAGARQRRCHRSQCSGPGDRESCGPGQQCVPMREAFLCRGVGERLSGEPCGPLGYAEVGTCAPGLQCANGLCLPVRCESDEDCPRGAVCGTMQADEPYRQCVSACDDDSNCPPDQSCVALPWGGRECARTDRARCLVEGCPGGGTCYVHHHVPWDMVATCESPCDASLDAPCPDGQLCLRTPNLNELTASHFCRAACELEAPACPDGFVCRELVDGGGVCIFDRSAATDSYFSRRYPPPGAR